jgi:hypothetical protein
MVVEPALTIRVITALLNRGGLAAASWFLAWTGACITLKPTPLPPQAMEPSQSAPSHANRTQKPAWITTAPDTTIHKAEGSLVSIQTDTQTDQILGFI